MKQRIIHGTEINFVTPDELVHLIPRPEETTFIRARASAQANAAGGLPELDVYKVPMGMRFEMHRIYFQISGITDPNSASKIGLAVAGKYIMYMRSGSLICFGEPTYGGTLQIPGGQTWSAKQGPRLQNGEVFQVAAPSAVFTAGLGIVCAIEGILTRPAVPPSGTLVGL